MQAIIGFFRELGWGVTVGIAILLVGAPLMYFLDSGETKEERAKRRERDAERAEDARSGPAQKALKAQTVSR